MAFKNNALSISKSLQEPSPSYNKHSSKYFTKAASIIALLLQKRKHSIMEMTRLRPPKHASARAGYRAQISSPQAGSTAYNAPVTSLMHLLVPYTKNMCFACKRKLILQTKHLGGGGEMEKLLAEVYSCRDIFHFLLLAPIFHTTFFLCLKKKKPQNPHQKKKTKPTAQQEHSSPLRKLRASITTETNKTHHRFHVFPVLMNVPSENTPQRSEYQHLACVSYCNQY